MQIQVTIPLLFCTNVLRPHTHFHSNKQNVVAFDLYGKGNNQCAKKKEGTYLMDVGAFAKAYTAQKQVDYQLVGNDYGNPEALDYVDCTAVEYNDAYVSVFRLVDLRPTSLQYLTIT